MSQSIAAGPLAWGALLGLLAIMILVDLKVGSAQRQMTVRTAAVWSAIWIAMAVTFGAGLWLLGDPEAGESYFAGYVMEKALSLDNVFVFTLIFSALAIPREEQPRVLLWGILIALGLRAIFIFAGAEALESYSWVAWPFAAILAWTGWRILGAGEERDEGARIVGRVQRRFPGLGGQRVRAARPASAVLPRLRRRRALCVPAAGARRPAHRHRRQARLRRGDRREGGRVADPRLNRRRPGRRHRRVAAQGAARTHDQPRQRGDLRHAGFVTALGELVDVFLISRD